MYRPNRGRHPPRVTKVLRLLRIVLPRPTKIGLLLGLKSLRRLLGFSIPRKKSGYGDGGNNHGKSFHRFFLSSGV
jgi:hypothetical protein